jgi:1-acyl-sn-glycerol-3-phosphate acyltransferase
VGGPLIVLRSLLYTLIFYPGTLAFVIAGLTASAIGQRETEAVVLAWSRWHHWLARNVLDIDTRVEGAIPPGPHLIAVKHQSMFETLEMVRIGRCPAVVMKRQLGAIPLFGRLTRLYGNIEVDREGGAKALRDLLSASAKVVAAGRSAVIFPEGTRVPVGATPPLQPGFAGLYRALRLPVVPIAMDSGRLWSHGLIKRPGVITFRIGETIPPGLKREEVEARVHAAINALELGAQARA